MAKPWKADVPPQLARFATPEVTGRIVAYRSGKITLGQLASEFAARTFVTPARLANKRAGESTREMYARVEDATYDTPGSWDEVDEARSTGLLSHDDYLALTRAVHAGHAR
ncbi:MAG: hypothetical protein V4472_25050 [Pseudomonadota bacterium]|mgnify:CR=1 FL=1